MRGYECLETIQIHSVSFFKKEYFMPVCVCVHQYMCVHMNEEAKGQPQMPASETPSTSSETGLLLSLEFMK